MRVFFSGIGGVGIGPLALIAHDLGFEVFGTNQEPTSITKELAAQEIDVEFQTSSAHLAAEHFIAPIDWLVYSSAIPSDHPELVFARANGIRLSKRDEFINEILQVESLRMIAVAGTAGKTTTTAMIVWLFEKLNKPVSYSIGSQISFGPTGAYETGSEFFVYECDEYDRNFLHFKPYMSLITSVDYDHPDSYPTPEDYTAAFQEFAQQSEWVMNWKSDESIFEGTKKDHFTVLDEADDHLKQITLPGQHNRENAWQAVQAVMELTDEPVEELIDLVNEFPGTARRFEKLEHNIYTDYAHHPAKIKAAIQLARELNDHVIVVYQPHQNIRQHAVQDDYAEAFAEAEKVYWTPTYLTREDPKLPVLSPEALAAKLNKPGTEVVDLNEDLADVLAKDAADGKLVMIMGAGPIDDWARANFG